MSNVKAVFLAAILILGGVTVANAQLVNGSVMRVNIPTSFVIRDRPFPAGNYTIERTPITNDSPSLMILRGMGESVVFDTFASRPSRNLDNSQLIFDIVGNTRHLSRIEVKGSDVAIALRPSRSVRELRASTRRVVVPVDTGF